MSYWGAFRDSIINISNVKKIETLGSEKDKVKTTNNRLKHLGLKTRFVINEGLIPTLTCNIIEEDREKLNEFNIFYKFLFRIYFKRGTVFPYYPSSILHFNYPTNIIIGQFKMNELFTKHKIPYCLSNLPLEHKVILTQNGKIIKI